MSENGELEKDRLELLRCDLAKRLEGFSSNAPAINVYELSSSRLARENFPVPEMLLLMLRNFLGWKWSGPREKVRWTVYGTFHGEPVAIELGKFGLTMLRSHALSKSKQRIEGQLKSAVNIVEKFIKPVLEQQVSSGNVTIGNHLSEFVSRYEFFRGQADKAFRLAERKAKEKPKGGNESPEGIISALMHGYSRSMKVQQEGFYHSVAMVDAYFSALEHRLNLLRAFTGAPLPEDGFKDFMSKNWNEKLDELLGANPSPAARKTLQGMREIKERIRNPFAHGGYENDKGALHVHIPSIGTIPGNITQFGKSARFSFIPVGANDHELNCAVFDDVDKLLCMAHLAGPYRLMEAGIDPSFDEESLLSYRDAISGGAEAMEEFIDHWNYMWELHTNMDY
ncbi:hypothetical protein OH720_30230 [Pseudomonas sp. WJP1]|uniref:hypothetical protein n=1 Tax=Pseudomonas sp. WJP1 TaxID=2986947 RepID=UPI00234BD377|nr:hypothetical protein [Pseudomonas sp. WJP1]WCM51163.1 hypothetical protein OH720_30230 [Pseudomonas sp. WJP1]